MTRIRLLILASLVAIAALVPSTAAANRKLQVGFLDNAYALTDPAAYWSDMKTLNAGFARWDIQWKHVAPKRPKQERNPADPAYHWGETDSFMRAAAAHGMGDRVMVTLWRTPSWAASIRKKPFEAQMPRLRDWRNFVYAAAKRYSGRYTPPGQTEPLPRILAWETWNEPNAHFALRPQVKNGIAVSPRNYVALLNALKTEVNRAVPFKPTFVAGAFYKQGGPRSLTPVQFMRGMQAAGARFDVLSVHPYNRNPSAGIRDGLSESRSNPYFIGIGNMDTFVRLSNEIFGRRHPVWITEFGVPTAAPQQAARVASPAAQARFVRDAINRMRALPQVERAAWFLVKDEHPRVGAWYTTGLRRADGTKKPAYDAWRKAAAKLQRSPVVE